MQLDSFKNENFLNTAPSLQSLEEWLVYLESLDPNNIELGLERVKKVFDALFLKSLEKCSIVEIAGTNGKGSTAAVIAATLDQSGIKYGLYTSPHVLDFRERIVINGQKVDTALLLEAFAKVKDCMERTHSPLTYFEFTTLAAFFCFKKSHVDALVLEIGLAGDLMQSIFLRLILRLLLPLIMIICSTLAIRFWRLQMKRLELSRKIHRLL